MCTRNALVSVNNSYDNPRNLEVCVHIHAHFMKRKAIQHMVKLFQIACIMWSHTCPPHAATKTHFYNEYPGMLFCEVSFLLCFLKIAFICLFIYFRHFLAFYSSWNFAPSPLFCFCFPQLPSNDFIFAHTCKHYLFYLYYNKHNLCFLAYYPTISSSHWFTSRKFLSIVLNNS